MCLYVKRGKGKEGQLGHNNENDLSSPRKVEALNGHFVTQVTGGDDHTAVVTSTGSLLTWGSNRCGVTGHGIDHGRQKTPKAIQNLKTKKIIFVRAGSRHTACVTINGEVYTWGDEEGGALGHGDEENCYIPKLVEALSGEKTNQLDCGGYHTIVCTRNGKVYSFGKGSRGQLGHGNMNDESTPKIVEALRFKFITRVVCGWTHSIALESNGRVLTWGDGNRGKLGNGACVGGPTPFLLERFINTKVVDVSSYGSHSVALLLPKRPFTSNMKNMVNNKSQSDVMFVLKDGHVYANKSILIGQSQYFRAMFQSNMRESTEDEIKIEGCSRPVFLLMMEYLYSNDVKIDIEHAVELYALSDLYQEISLGKICQEVLERDLTCKNALELLEKSQALGYHNLAESCLTFIHVNFEGGRERFLLLS